MTDTTAFPALRNEMAAVPQVTALAGTRSHIGYGFRNVIAESEQKKSETNFMEVGRDYIKTMNLKLAEGREFDPQMEGDFTKLDPDYTKSRRKLWLERQRSIGQENLSSTVYIILLLVY